MKRTIILVVSLVSITGALAGAGNRGGDQQDPRDFPRYDEPQKFTCLSMSKQLPFIAQDPLQLMAKTRAIQACQASQQTDNTECAQNVQCQPSTPSWMTVECSTNSKSLPFDATGEDELTIKAQAIQVCEASQQTSNAECAQNAACVVQYRNPNSAYSCLSESIGLMFTSHGADMAIVKDTAIRACQATQQTNNAECMSTAVCEQVSSYYIPTAACTTQSHSMPFAIEEQKYRFDVMADAVRSCQASQQTDNRECRNNVQCEISDPR